MKTPPWDQRIARVLVKPLVKSPVTPNQMTMFTLAVAVAGAGLLATGDAVNADWGAGLFVLARFLDHFDGELARQKDMTSRLGYYLDYVSGALSYAALFLCMGFGFIDSPLGPWAIVLGAAGAASAVVSMFTNLGIDKHIDLEGEKDAIGYPGFAGFELEDGIYLLAPITWAGFLMPFFVAAGIGAGVYCLWTCWTLLRLRRG
ncbi:MAG: CDP-alcohol phosphatidyltransferase family protein [Proteobacteria bacterium]|nr:CDP-alcohol phosphatidyltransferase family protein [Pseudomonadota bacterium]